MHKNARLTPQGRTPAGAAGHRTRVWTVRASRRGCGTLATAGLPLAGALSCGRRRSARPTAARRRSAAPTRCRPRASPRSRGCAANASAVRRSRTSSPCRARRSAAFCPARARQARRARAEAAGGALPARTAGRADPHRHQEARAHRGGRPSHHRPPARQHARRRLGGLHVCIEDASRLAYSEVLPDERKASAVAFLERAVGWFEGHGVTVSAS